MGGERVKKTDFFLSETFSADIPISPLTGFRLLRNKWQHFNSVSLAGSKGRKDQSASVAARIPPRKDWGPGHRTQSQLFKAKSSLRTIVAFQAAG